MVLVPLDFKIFNCSIEVIFYEKMLLLFIDEYKRIKIIYKGLLENNIELIQLNIDFLIDGSIKDNKDDYLTPIKKSFSNLLSFLNQDNISPESNYMEFKNKYSLNNCDKLLDYINDLGMSFF